MSKLPVVSANKVIKALSKLGFKIHRQTGSHIHLYNPEKRLVVTVPNHKELAKGTLAAILKQADITRKKLIKNN